MRRHRRDQADSLELFLDTICNTFGGILFLALLVCVLSRNVGHVIKSPKDIETARLQYAELASQVRKLSAEDKHLSESILRQQQLLEAMSISKEDINDASKLLEEIQELESQISKTDSSIAEKREKQASVVNEYQKISDRLKVLGSELQQKKVEIATRFQKQEIKVRLPISRPTFKIEVPVLLLGGRVYEPFEYESDGFSRTIKSSYYKALLDDELTVDEIRKQTGLVMNTQDQVVHWRKKLTKPLSPDSHYIGLAVWPDSYNEFIRIRNDLVEQGYEYRLLILNQGEPLTFGRQVHGVVQ